jgi:hypothetical protein
MRKLMILAASRLLTAIDDSFERHERQGHGVAGSQHDNGPESNMEK